MVPTVLATQTAVCADGKHTEVEISRIPATPTEDGERVLCCSVCGMKWTSILLATDHQWGSWVIITPATCTKAGERYRICTRGATHPEYEPIAALGHEYVEISNVHQSCTVKGARTFECSRCGDKVSRTAPALGHQYKEIVMRKPTCMEEGLKKFECTRDTNHSYLETIPSLGGHDFGEWYEDTPPEVGFPGVEKRVCSRNENHIETREIPALKPAPKTKPPAPKLKPKPDPQPEPAPTPTKLVHHPRPIPPIINTADVVIGSVNTGMLIMFSFVITPYIKSSKYIRKRRKQVGSIADTRRMVAAKYDFI